MSKAEHHHKKTPHPGEWIGILLIIVSLVTLFLPAIPLGSESQAWKSAIFDIFTVASLVAPFLLWWGYRHRGRKVMRWVWYFSWLVFLFSLLNIISLVISHFQR